MSESRLHRGARLAPFLLTRLAGVPFDAMNDLVSPCTHHVVTSVLRTEALLTAMGSSLCDAMYRIAGSAEITPDLRRHLVNARRDLFNLRIPQRVDLIQRCLTQDEAALLGRWVEEARRLHLAWQNGEQILHGELDDTTAHLQHWSQYPGFAQAIVLASLPLHQKLQTYVRTPVVEQNRRLRKVEPSLVMYLTRAATKTSPFSTLTPVAMGVWDDEGPSSVRWEPAHRRWGPSGMAAINQAHVMRLAAGIAAHPDFRDHVRLRLNPTLNCDSERYTAYGCFDQHHMGRVAFAGERLVAVARTPEIDWLVDMIRNGADRWSGVERLATGLDIEYLRAVLEVLVNAQVVEAYWSISEHDPNYISALVEALKSVPGGRSSDLRANLDDMTQILTDLPGLPAQERSSTIQSLSSRFATACRLVDLDPTSLGSLSIFEDAAWPDTSLEANPHHWRSALKGLSLVQMTLPLFDRWRLCGMVMRDFFIQQYGFGGTCTDVISFVLDIHEYIPFLQGRTNVQIAEAVEHDKVRKLVALFASHLQSAVCEAGQGREVVLESDRLERLCEGIPEPLLSFPDAHSYFVQPVPATGQFVLNQIAAGMGRSVARYAHLLDHLDEGRFSQVLNRYLGQVTAPGQKTLELPGSFGFNANRRPAYGETWLDYPGVNLVDDERERIRVHDLCIRHCPKANRLLLIHRQSGTELLPLNLGALTFLLAPVLFRGLSLFNPVGNVDLPLLDLLESGLTQEQRSEVRRYPRIRLEGTYLMRETWVIPRSRLPVRRKEASDFEFACQVERWRQELGLPRRVFVRATLEPDQIWARAVLGVDGGGSAEIRDLHRKPQYVDFQSQVMVDVLSRHFCAVDTVLVVQEMLPGPEDLLVSPTGDRVVSEWIVELLATP